MERELVPGRTCGTCNACCISLTIDDPELQKPQGYRCRNARRDASCAIYESRPQTCRSFFCGWRQLKWVHESLRPDVSHVLVRLRRSIGRDGVRQVGVAFMLLDRAALKAEGLAESVAAGVAAGIPVYLNVPGPPGYTSAIAQINDVLAGAVLTKDRAGLLDVLRQAVAKAKSGKFVPIVMGQGVEKRTCAGNGGEAQESADMLGDRL